MLLMKINHLRSTRRDTTAVQFHRYLKLRGKRFELRVFGYNQVAAGRVQFRHLDGNPRAAELGPCLGRFPSAIDICINNAT